MYYKLQLTHPSQNKTSQSRPIQVLCLKLSLILFLTILTTALQAQSKEEAVKAAIQKLFDAMRNADSATSVSVFAPGAHMETITKNRQQADTIRTNTVAEFGASIKRQPAGSLDERIEFSSILIDANLAHVWTPYKFYLNGNFNHCGVNSFELVQLNGSWKIRYIIDTRRKDGCD